jgi:hypothetical protein
MQRYSFRTRLERAWRDTGFRLLDAISSLASIAVVYLILSRESSERAALDEAIAISAGVATFIVIKSIELARNYLIAAYRLEIDRLDAEMTAGRYLPQRAKIYLRLEERGTRQLELGGVSFLVRMFVGNEGIVAAENAVVHLVSVVPTNDRWDKELPWEMQANEGNFHPSDRVNSKQELWANAFWVRLHTAFPKDETFVAAVHFSGQYPPRGQLELGETYDLTFEVTAANSAPHSTTMSIVVDENFLVNMLAREGS